MPGALAQLCGNAHPLACLADRPVSVLVKRSLLELGSSETEAEQVKHEERALGERITAFEGSNQLSRDDLHRRGE